MRRALNFPLFKCLSKIILLLRPLRTVLDPLRIRGFYYDTMWLTLEVIIFERLTANVTKPPVTGEENLAVRSTKHRGWFLCGMSKVQWPLNIIDGTQCQKRPSHTYPSSKKKIIRFKFSKGAILGQPTDLLVIKDKAV